MFLFAVAFFFSLVAPVALAQANKPAPAVPATPNATKPAAPATPTTNGEKPTAAAKARSNPFNTTVDEVDAVGKSFTHFNKDGKKVKHLITETTIFKGEATGKKFEDIKVGDAMNGSRVKLNDAGTEYEVVSITLVGVRAARPTPKK